MYSDTCVVGPAPVTGNSAPVSVQVWPTLPQAAPVCGGAVWAALPESFAPAIGLLPAASLLILIRALSKALRFTRPPWTSL